MRYERCQLPLPLEHPPIYDARDFIATASNQEALAWLEADWPDGRLALFGPPGCGKSHLLHVWARREGAIVIAGQVLADLETIPMRGGLALDNADNVADETLLLHLLNTVRDRNIRLLLCSQSAPSHWATKLPDLVSRLRAIATAEIRPPDDDLLAALLVKMTADRQLSMTQAAMRWMLANYSRSPSDIRNAVTRLDRASLAGGIPITRRLAVQVLEEDVSPVRGVDEVSEPGHAFSSDEPGLL